MSHDRGARDEGAAEETLLGRAKVGDERAFDLLFERYARALRGKIRRVLPARVTRKVSVADVLQEVRITACARLASMLATCPIAELRNRFRAVELAEVAARQSPCRRPEWRILGIARLRDRKDQDALDALERGDVGILPDLAYYRALAYVRLGKRNAAEHMLHDGDRRRQQLEWEGPDLMELREEVKHALAQ